MDRVSDVVLRTSGGNCPSLEAQITVPLQLCGLYPPDAFLSHLNVETRASCRLQVPTYPRCVDKPLQSLYTRGLPTVGPPTSAQFWLGSASKILLSSSWTHLLQPGLDHFQAYPSLDSLPRVPSRISLYFIVTHLSKLIIHFYIHFRFILFLMQHDAAVSNSLY